MLQPKLALFLLPIYLTPCLSDLLGPTYPAPLDLSSEVSTVPAAWDDFVQILASYLDGSNEDAAVTETLTGLENITFSIGAFSLYDPSVSESLQYHYTAPAIQNSANGTKKVDADTIYQVASITKLFTVYAGLLELTDEQWNTPLTECIPAFGEYVANHDDKDDSIVSTPWEMITPWTLANQISGIASNPWLLDLMITAPQLAELGLPITPEAQELGNTALESQSLDDKLFLDFTATLPSVLAPWSSAQYSNNGFILLGIALKNLLGKPYADLIQDTVAGPLGLTSTSGAPPSDANALNRSAILSPANFAPAPLLASSGGIFTTLNDLALFGTAILNSTQLPANQTRKWMKPSAHTASLNHSVGAPWEILRFTNPNTGKVTDLYTKSGDSGDATSHLVLVPDYGFGFTYLSIATGDDLPVRQKIIEPILDLLTTSILPALDLQATTEARANFGGTYTSTVPELNASVTIAWNESDAVGAAPALTLTGFSYNNTDLLTPGLLFAASKPRLLLTFPDTEGKGQVAFQATSNPNVPGGLFSTIQTQNYDWLTFGGQTWSGQPVASFVFEVDGEGKATAVVPAVLGLKLERVPEEKE